MEGMKTIDRAWYTHEHQVSRHEYTLSKEKIEKENERDQNMDKIMTQIDVLSKKIHGGWCLRCQCRGGFM